MLRNRRFSAILSLFMLLMVVLGSGMDGFVLCIMPDGKITIEQVSGSCCDENVKPDVDTSAKPSTRETSQSDDHHCDSCVDVPLPNSELFCQYANDVSAKLRIANLASAPFMAARTRWIVKEGVSSLPPPAVKTSLVSLCTVSLLI